MHVSLKVQIVLSLERLPAAPHGAGPRDWQLAARVTGMESQDCDHYRYRHITLILAISQTAAVYVFYVFQNRPKANLEFSPAARRGRWHDPRSRARSMASMIGAGAIRSAREYASRSTYVQYVPLSDSGANTAPGKSLSAA